MRYRSVCFIFLICSVLNLITAQDLPEKMRAVGYFKSLPISDPESLVDLEVDVPKLRNKDVLVEVKAVGVDPIDTIIRVESALNGNVASILGWDGSGVVVAKGNQVNKFNIGDEVIFIGDFRRNGSNAQYVALDEVVVGPKPKKLTFEEAAGMPLTGTTAYESIYDRFALSEKDRGKTILIINSAGGVGSIASQLAKNLGLTVIGTASRPETEAFSRANGVDIVINYKKDIKGQLDALGYKNGVDFILINYDPYPYWNTVMNIIKPQGKICLLVKSTGLVDVQPMLWKGVTLLSEMLLTRVLYDTEDKYGVQDILEKVSKMLDDGTLKPTLTKTLSPFNAKNIRKAQRLAEEQHIIGKLVVTGF